LIYSLHEIEIYRILTIREDNNMTIKFTESQDNGKNLGVEKEIVEIRQLIAFDGKEFKELATVRWYMSRSKSADRVYCSIWVTGHVFGQYTSGHGHTSGYGFCKLSDSFERALNSAGIYSDEPISGRGMSRVDALLEKLALHAGFENSYIARG
jgi:hypothetical protein